MVHCRCCMYNNFLGVLVFHSTKEINCCHLSPLRRAAVTSCHSPLATGPKTQLVRKPKTGTNSTLSRTHWSILSFPLLSSPHPRRSFLSFLHTYAKRALLSPPSIPLTSKSPMLLTSFAFLICASASALAQQVVYDTAHNVTPITGTWSSGAMNVVTGPVRMFVHFTVALIHYREM